MHTTWAHQTRRSGQLFRPGFIEITPIPAKRQSFSRPISLCKSLFFSPIITVFLQCDIYLSNYVCKKIQNSSRLSSCLSYWKWELFQKEIYEIFNDETWNLLNCKFIPLSKETGRHIYVQKMYVRVYIFIVCVNCIIIIVYLSLMTFSLLFFIWGSKTCKGFYFYHS